MFCFIFLIIAYDFVPLFLFQLISFNFYFVTSLTLIKFINFQVSFLKQNNKKSKRFFFFFFPCWLPVLKQSMYQIAFAVSTSIASVKQTCQISSTLISLVRKKHFLATCYFMTCLWLQKSFIQF